MADKKSDKNPSEGDAMRITDSVTIKLTRASDKAVMGQRTSDEIGRQSGVDFDGAGGARLTAVGKPRTNEQGTKEAVERLSGELYRRGAITGPWQVVTDQEDKTIAGGVDCEIRAQPTQGLKAKPVVLKRVQVIRAGTDLHLRNLGQSKDDPRHATVESVDSLADRLLAAVEKKANHYGNMKNVVLALDADDHHASLAVLPVVESFRSRHLSRARSAGFESVWLIGPMVVFRLDG